MEGSLTCLDKQDVVSTEEGSSVWIYQRVTTCDSLPSPVSTPVNIYRSDGMLRIQHPITSSPFYLFKLQILSIHRLFGFPEDSPSSVWKGHGGNVAWRSFLQRFRAGIFYWFPVVSLLAGSSLDSLTEWQTIGNQNRLRSVCWFGFSRLRQVGRGEKSSQTKTRKETVMVLAPTLGYKPSPHQKCIIYSFFIILSFFKSLYFFIENKNWKSRLYFLPVFLIYYFYSFSFSFCGASAFMAFYSYY